MRVLLSAAFAVTFAGSAAGENINGFEVGQDYVCATTSANYQTISNGVSGGWSNAPKTMSLKIKPCVEATGGICSDVRSSTMYQLQRTIQIDGEGYNSFLQGTAFGFWNGLSFANLDKGKIYYIEKGVLGDESEEFAAFTLMAECFPVE